MAHSGFICTACRKTQAADFAGYVCPDCGANLQVSYDHTALRAAASKPGFWYAGRQDVFRYLPLLPLKSADKAPTLRIGSTPLYPAPRLGKLAGLKNLLIKDDGLNPSGSFKDRASAIALARARESGAAVVCGASTGNAGSSMACLSASVGQPCVIFVPEKAPAAKIAQLLIFGAKVVAVRGTYDDAFELCHQVCLERGWFNRNTGFNPFTREGKKTGSLELLEQLGWKAPDRVVVCVGDGNIISGLWKGIKDAYALGLIDRLPKLDCAQSAQSNAITLAVESLRAKGLGFNDVDWSTFSVPPVKATTLADSISVDLPRDGLAAVQAIMESGGAAITVDDSDILRAMPEIPRNSGVFVEPSAATSWACIKKAARDGVISPDESVVCFFTGSGLKDVARAREVAGEPATIDNNLDAARSALDRLLKGA